jgi:hypothetical protein
MSRHIRGETRLHTCKFDGSFQSLRSLSRRRNHPILTQDVATISSIEGFMTDVSIYDAVDEFESALRSRLVKTSGYPRLATYAGYAKGTEAGHALYGSSLAKLLTLKNEWDPKGLFSHSKPIQ